MKYLINYIFLLIKNKIELKIKFIIFIILLLLVLDAAMKNVAIYSVLNVAKINV